MQVQGYAEAMSNAFLAASKKRRALLKAKPAPQRDFVDEFIASNKKQDTFINNLASANQKLNRFFATMEASSARNQTFVDTYA